jgi:transposase
MSISEPMHMLKPEAEAPRRIEVFTGTGRRRASSPDEKAAVVAESHVMGETVCGVGRRHGLTPLQLFTWRREARLRSGAPYQAEALFVPAVVDGSSSGPVRQQADRSAALLSSIELEIDGIMVRIGREAPANTIGAVLRGGRHVSGPTGAVRVMVATRPGDFRKVPRDWQRWCARP